MSSLLMSSIPASSRTDFMTRFSSCACGLLLALPLLSGCFIVDDDLLDGLGDGAVDTGTVDASTDTGSPDTTPPDTGPTGPQPVDTCGDDDNVFVISETTEDLLVDTTVLNNRLSAECTGNDSDGNDGFFAIDVVPGQFWHFHLRSDPTDPTSVDRDPSLYLLDNCDPRRCEHSSDVCDGNKDEHFAFVADSPGRWYIGVDDRSAGGGRYLLDAILPQCGNGIAEHGESCDGEDGCVACRWVVNEANPAEQIPNDNFVEANVIRLPADDRELVVRGSIGGSCYPDLFSYVVPPGGGTFSVRALDSSDSVCSARAQARFDLELLSSGLDNIGGGNDAATGCPIIETPVTEGRYFVRVSIDAERPEAYRLQMRFTP